MEQRKLIKLSLEKNPSPENLSKKQEIENLISKETETQFMHKVQVTLSHITGDDGGISKHGLWKAKKYFIPNDKGGNHVT